MSDMQDQDDKPKTPKEVVAVYTGAERWEDLQQWRKAVDKRLDDGAATMRSMRKELADNTTSTKSVQSNTSEVVELLNSFKGAFSVLEKLGKLAKPLGYIVGLLTAIGTLIAMVKGWGSSK